MAMAEAEKDSELTTTVDPSYVIRLIRRILPVHSGDQVMEDAPANDGENLGNSDEDPREESGCVLWDLAANEVIADLMVENYIVDVLLSILEVPHSDRMGEICVGILGNLAYHKKPGREIAKKEGMLWTIVKQLDLTDTQTLIETCRLLNVGLHGDEVQKWTEALKSDEVLERVLWIAQNTLNEQLIEKVLELLKAMVDSSKPTASNLLPSLIRLGLLDVLTSLLSLQVSAIIEGSVNGGDVVLDLVLQIALEISISSEHSELLAYNEKLLAVVFQVIRLSGKDDVGVSAVTGMVLIANLLGERSELTAEICQDGVLVERLLALMRTINDDADARNALWSIIGCICRCSTFLPESKRSLLVLTIANGSTFLVNDVEEEMLDDGQQNIETKLAVVNELLKLLRAWLVSHDTADSNTITLVQNACKEFERVLP